MTQDTKKKHISLTDHWSLLVIWLSAALLLFIPHIPFAQLDALRRDHSVWLFLVMVPAFGFWLRLAAPRFWYYVAGFRKRRRMARYFADAPVGVRAVLATCLHLENPCLSDVFKLVKDQLGAVPERLTTGLLTLEELGAIDSHVINVKGMPPTTYVFLKNSIWTYILDERGRYADDLPKRIEQITVV